LLPVAKEPTMVNEEKFYALLTSAIKKA
jgi:hypothetical protein